MFKNVLVAAELRGAGVMEASSMTWAAALWKDATEHDAISTRQTIFNTKNTPLAV